jgi:hypothetical protein
MSQFHHNFIATVIDTYGLELDVHQVDNLIAIWFQQYDPAWIVKAIVESLYRGRYKIKSVDNILKDWKRLGKPRYNFTPEYEREILQNLPSIVELALPPPTPITVSAPVDRIEPEFIGLQPVELDSKQLNPEESAPFHRHHHSPSTDRCSNRQSAPVEVSTGADRNLGHPNQTPAPPTDRFSFSRSLQTLVPVSKNRQPAAGVPQIVPQPAKLQLFNTLKAIVEPKERHRSAFSSAEYLPLASEYTNCPDPEKFQLSIETIGEEKYL